MGTKVEYKTISKTTKDFSILFEKNKKNLKITVHITLGVGLSTTGGPHISVYSKYQVLFFSDRLFLSKKARSQKVK